MHAIPERSALDHFPDTISYSTLREAAEGCKGCDIYRNATQVVFGEGPVDSPLVFVGEQPGNEEDIKGHPFVGPAGRLFDKALIEAGIDRSRVYITNAVKHFKWKPQGKRRLHERPKASEVEACLPWLAAELEVVEPSILVLMGATAAQALLGPDFRVTKERGVWLATPFAGRTIATVHPSSILRAYDSDARETQYAEFVADLRVVAEAFGTVPK